MTPTRRLDHSEGGHDLSGVSLQAPKEYQLGVLLVHGIGSQRSGETLVRWGDVLLQTIGRATNYRVSATALQAGPDDEGRAEAVVRLRAGESQESWLLCEGWWADAFLAPSYRELVSWSVTALPWSIALRIAQRYWTAAESGKVSNKIVSVVKTYAWLPIALLFAPLYIAILAIGLVAGLLPIPQLRTRILAARGGFAAIVGDSLAFVKSPIRAALIRTRVLGGLARLKQCCETTVVVAHSQGAAVAMDALGGILGTAAETSEATRQDPLGPRVVPDSLVTFGAGTALLVSLKVLSARFAKVEKNPTLLATIAIVIAIGLSLWLFVDVIAQRITFLDILKAVGVALAPSAVAVFVGLIIYLALKLWPNLGTRSAALLVSKPWLQRLSALLSFLLLSGFLLGTLVAWGSLSRSVPFKHAPLNRVTFLAAAFVVLGIFSYRILSQRMKSLVEQVRRPLGLHRWIDLYASHDPVPNGPMRTTEPGVPESVRIWNLGSRLADHSAYWDNLDGFVLRVLRECAETAMSPWRDELSPVPPAVDARAAWRVGWLRLARRAVGIAWLTVGASVWFKYSELVPQPLKLPAWLPAVASKATRVAVLLGGIALIHVASCGLLRSLWRFWVRAEQDRVLANQWPGGNGVLPRGRMRVTLFFMAMIVWMVFGLSWLLLEGLPSDWLFNYLLLVFTIILMLAGISTVVSELQSGRFTRPLDDG